MITVISLIGRSLSSVVSDPISAVISSLTILMTICPGLSPLRTSSPTALSCTEETNCLTTLKFTSASSKAILTSLSAAFTSSSERRPLPLKFLNTFCNLSVRLSKAINYVSSSIIFPDKILRFFLSSSLDISSALSESSFRNSASCLIASNLFIM